MTTPTREELLAKVETLQRENAELREALQEYVALSDVSLDSIERVSAEFHKATGYLAPGKDIPAAMDSDGYRERRQRLWNEWVRDEQDARLARARAALKTGSAR